MAQQRQETKTQSGKQSAQFLPDRFGLNPKVGQWCENPQAQHGRQCPRGGIPSGEQSKLFPHPLTCDSLQARRCPGQLLFGGTGQTEFRVGGREPKSSQDP